MSIATTSLKYGWKVLAILTIGTGTIFVADNVLNRITTKDRIEVTLAVVERCLGTQYGTNGAGEPLYRVPPPSIVRTWTDTNGASVIMTNAIAWRDDLSMKVELDAKIKALVPCYVDPATLQTLTVTGLWASLDIGDGTNQFTQTPAIGTNAATYGPWAWRNYVVAWQERYKVLNALSRRIITESYSVSNNYLYGEILDVNVGTMQEDYAEAISLCEATNQLSSAALSGMSSHTYGQLWNTYYPSGESVSVRKSVWKNTTLTTTIDYQLAVSLEVYIKIGSYSGGWGDGAIYTNKFDSNGSPGIKDEYTLWGASSASVSNYVTVNFDVSSDSTWFIIPPVGEGPNSKQGFSFVGVQLLIAPTFYYCVDKYW